MKVNLQFYATLGEYLPEGAQRNCAEIYINPNDTVTDIIQSYHVPNNMAHLVLLNGVYLAPSRREETTLAEGDVLAVWPPIAGG